MQQRPSRQRLSSNALVVIESGHRKIHQAQNRLRVTELRFEDSYCLN
jgi:hypothetical protein